MIRKELHHHPPQRFNDSIAEVYNQARPTYPPELLSALACLASQGWVLDVGCGTGISSRLLEEGPYNVIGLDASHQMLQVAEESAESNIHYLCSLAEYLPVRNESVSLIASAQAFHWFETTKTCAEFHRVLIDGGHVALFWNVRKKENVLNREYEDLCRHYFPEYELVVKREESSVCEKLWFENGFSTEKRECFLNYQHLDFTGFKQRILSTSFVHHGLSDKTRPKFEKELLSLFKQHAEQSKIVIEYECKLYLFKKISAFS